MANNMFGSKANQAPLNADLGELAYLDTEYLEATYLKQSGGTLTGNLAFSGNSRRVLGDFSNATLGNRLYLQASTDNAATAVGAIPNGTGNSAAFNVFNSSDPANAGYLQFLINATEARLYSGFTGTGATLPMTFHAGGSERMRISAAGNVGIGKSGPDQLLQVLGGNIDLQEQVAGRRIGFYVGDSYTSGTVGAAVPTARYGLTFGSYVGSSVNLGGWGGLTFSTTDVERLRITNAGAIGIGGANYGTAGQVLTSGGSGAAPTWTFPQWQIKTTTYTAVAGDNILANTTAGAFTITLPASPATNDYVAVADYKGTFATNNLTINSNGLNLMGSVQTLILNVNYRNVTLVYSGATQGWVLVL